VTLRVASIAALLVLGGATVAFARPGLGNSHERGLRSTQIACGSERREVKTPPRDPPKSFVELHGSARITGGLFFDFAHHQRGRAPNVAELHPVLRVTNVECSRA
jgi:hypothetical protein